MSSQPWLNGRRGFGGRHDRDDFELDEVAPVADPLIEQAAIVAFHDLVAGGQLGGDPAVDVPQSLGRQPAALVETTVDGERVTVFVVFDDHVEHRRRRYLRRAGGHYRGGKSRRALHEPATSMLPTPAFSDRPSQVDLP